MPFVFYKRASYLSTNTLGVSCHRKPHTKLSASYLQRDPNLIAHDSLLNSEATPSASDDFTSNPGPNPAATESINTAVRSLLIVSGVAGIIGFLSCVLECVMNRDEAGLYPCPEFYNYIYS